MPEHFSEGARQVLVFAQEEAQLFNHSFIGTEHFLLGLVREGEGVAAQALARSGVSVEAARNEVQEKVGTVSKPPGGAVPYTPRAKKVLELAKREAMQLGHRSIGTEHLLLGLIREGEAVHILRNLGVDHGQLRQEVIGRMSGSPLDNPHLAKVLRAVGLAENERNPAPQGLIAEKCGLGISEVKSCLAEAHGKALVTYFSGRMGGWSLTPEGKARIEEG